MKFSLFGVLDIHCKKVWILKVWFHKESFVLTRQRRDINFHSIDGVDERQFPEFKKM